MERVTSFSTSAAAIGLTLVLVAYVWVVVVAPPLISFGLAVATAIAWCIWLEKHPSAPVDEQ